MHAWACYNNTRVTPFIYCVMHGMHYRHLDTCDNEKHTVVVCNNGGKPSPEADRAACVSNKLTICGYT